MVGAHKNDHHPSDEGTERTVSAGHGQPSAKPALPTAQALLEMKAESESLGSTCALLTPAIKTKLKSWYPVRCSRFGSTIQLPGKILEPGVVFPETSWWR